MNLSAMPGHLEEAMTVNRVLQCYPKTKRVFEQLFINIPYEGADCLDEVAWRHGMDSHELLEKLEQELGSASGANIEREGVCGCAC